MKTLTKIFLIVAVSLLIVNQVRAQGIGSAFTYQGKLSESGSPVVGEFDFEFKLFIGDTSAVQISSTIKKENVPVTAGAFTVPLDFGDVFDESQRWLEIGVRAGELADPNIYTILFPRQELTPTPYARYAHIAGSIAGSDTPEIVYDSDWLNMPMRNQLNLDLGTTDYDFVLPWMHTWNSSAGEVLRPMLSAVDYSFAPGYVSLFNSSLTAVGYDYLASAVNLGDRAFVNITEGNVRYIGVKRTPNFDSGWFSCNPNQTFSFNHNIGVLPHFTMVEVAQNPDGSGWRVPTMSSSNYSGGASWRQTSIVKLDSNQVIVRTQGGLAQFRNTATGTIQSPPNGYCRVRLWNWLPDYDSGWKPISITAGNRDHWIEHNLGQTPRMAMLYLTQNPDGSGWTIPAMSHYVQNNTFGTVIYNMTDRWTVIKGGLGVIARFADQNGVTQNPTTGFFRFLAWK